MRNIWFTIYSSTKDDDKYIGLENYRTLLELLLIPAIQNKINRNKKAQKIMLDFSPHLENDNVENFIKWHYNKKPYEGIINLDVSTKGVDWNTMTDQERKDFLIEKWKVLFNNLSDDYFVVDKYEVIKSLEELKKEKWKHTSLLFKKKLKYNKEIYSIIMDVSVEKASLALVRESDEKWFILKEYEPWKIMMNANFKNFKLINEDTLMLENKTIFLPPEVFDLKEVLTEKKL
ncbi:hypothetical protein NAL32_20490 [Chryseobacterium sp. Ch-15]|uniref:Uncharacterized protein n=1 Tax=Chryseobacterium muglaense TaxID=2893752 RepID=A0A9Q3YV73_9FLAO|nr:hypothetical protein [Chryseobacterium muglaense]MBD3907098.1 hypothetical protein [Chryseobacterium muglaense]MCC9036547.1 hypothetical protein [Chryseobacterium muglaense]MCM2556773.1 hypothetical protein [Chryseobacterium muglaense]